MRTLIFLFCLPLYLANNRVEIFESLYSLRGQDSETAAFLLNPLNIPQFAYLPHSIKLEGSELVSRQEFLTFFPPGIEIVYTTDGSDPFRNPSALTTLKTIVHRVPYKPNTVTTFYYQARYRQVGTQIYSPLSTLNLVSGWLRL